MSLVGRAAEERSSLSQPKRKALEECGPWLEAWRAGCAQLWSGCGAGQRGAGAEGVGEEREAGPATLAVMRSQGFSGRKGRAEGGETLRAAGWLDPCGPGKWVRAPQQTTLCFGDWDSQGPGFQACPRP